MTKPRSKAEIKFPFIFEKNGRTGRIKKWSGKFGTYFMFAGQKRRSSMATFEAAYEYLDREFSKLDADPGNSETLHSLRHKDRKTYAEFERRLMEEGNGATLGEAVQYYLDNHLSVKFAALSVSKCIEAFLKAEKSNNNSVLHNDTLTRHLGHFEREFGARRIHELATLEISGWLANAKSPDGKPWSPKTRRNVRGSLVSMSLYAKKVLKAFPAGVTETEFQLVKTPKLDVAEEVEIYTPDQFKKLLLAAIEHDTDLIPALVLGGFEGLRPDEFHGENVRNDDEAADAAEMQKKTRDPLKWENIHWSDKRVDVIGKVRSKARRHVPLHPVAKAWLEPFKNLTGAIWKFKKSYTHKMRSLCEKAEVPRLDNALRHSYGSYRIRILEGNLPALAQEMGNSPAQIIKSYKADVPDALAKQWFSLMPPADYAISIRKAL